MVTWLNPLAQNTGDSKTNNKQIVGVPPWATDFLFDWHPKYLHGVAFNTNIHYNSKRAANVFNTAWASEYVTLDLGVRYSTKLCDHQLVFRGGVNNVTDENYWSSVFSKSSAGAVQGASNVAVAGAPRTWHITASIYF
ncbi:hypothetical protein FAI41_05330 [Acetobacteraceae bacterium]|nr:hypothetical protein FAI41_05330 [Acetobacteraceae bacterium]